MVTLFTVDMVAQLIPSLVTSLRVRWKKSDMIIMGFIAPARVQKANLLKLGPDLDERIQNNESAFLFLSGTRIWIPLESGKYRLLLT